MSITAAAKNLIAHLKTEFASEQAVQLVNAVESAIDTAEASAIHVVVCDRDESEPSSRICSIVFETNCHGATLEASKQRAAQLCRCYGECRVARLEFVGTPVVRQTQKESQ